MHVSDVRLRSDAFIQVRIMHVSGVRLRSDAFIQVRITHVSGVRLRSDAFIVIRRQWLTLACRLVVWFLRHVLNTRSQRSVRV